MATRTDAKVVTIATGISTLQQEIAAYYLAQGNLNTGAIMSNQVSNWVSQGVMTIQDDDALADGTGSATVFTDGDAADDGVLDTNCFTVTWDSELNVTQTAGITAATPICFGAQDRIPTQSSQLTASGVNF